MSRRRVERRDVPNHDSASSGTSISRSPSESKSGFSSPGAVNRSKRYTEGVVRQPGNATRTQRPVSRSSDSGSDTSWVELTKGRVGTPRAAPRRSESRASRTSRSSSAASDNSPRKGSSVSSGDSRSSPTGPVASRRSIGSSRTSRSTSPPGPASRKKPPPVATTTPSVSQGGMAHNASCTGGFKQALLTMVGGGKKPGGDRSQPPPKSKSHLTSYTSTISHDAGTLVASRAGGTQPRRSAYTSRSGSASTCSCSDSNCSVRFPRGDRRSRSRAGRSGSSSSCSTCTGSTSSRSSSPSSGWSDASLARDGPPRRRLLDGRRSPWVTGGDASPVRRRGGARFSDVMSSDDEDEFDESVSRPGGRGRVRVPPHAAAGSKSLAMVPQPPGASSNLTTRMNRLAQIAQSLDRSGRAASIRDITRAFKTQNEAFGAQMRQPQPYLGALPPHMVYGNSVGASSPFRSPAYPPPYQVGSPHPQVYGGGLAPWALQQPHGTTTATQQQMMMMPTNQPYAPTVMHQYPPAHGPQQLVAQQPTAGHLVPSMARPAPTPPYPQRSAVSVDPPPSAKRGGGIRRSLSPSARPPAPAARRGASVDANSFRTGPSQQQGTSAAGARTVISHLEGELKYLRGIVRSLTRTKAAAHRERWVETLPDSVATALGQQKPVNGGGGAANGPGLKKKKRGGRKAGAARGRAATRAALAGTTPNQLLLLNSSRGGAGNGSLGRVGGSITPRVAAGGGLSPALRGRLGGSSSSPLRAFAGGEPGAPPSYRAVKGMVTGGSSPMTPTAPLFMGALPTAPLNWQGERQEASWSPASKPPTVVQSTESKIAKAVDATLHTTGRLVSNAGPPSSPGGLTPGEASGIRPPLAPLPKFSQSVNAPAAGMVSSPLRPGLDNRGPPPSGPPRPANTTPTASPPPTTSAVNSAALASTTNPKARVVVQLAAYTTSQDQMTVARRQATAGDQNPSLGDTTLSPGTKGGSAMPFDSRAQQAGASSTSFASTLRSVAVVDQDSDDEDPWEDVAATAMDMYSVKKLQGANAGALTAVL